MGRRNIHKNILTSQKKIIGACTPAKKGDRRSKNVCARIDKLERACAHTSQNVCKEPQMCVPGQTHVNVLVHERQLWVIPDLKNMHIS